MTNPQISLETSRSIAVNIVFFFNLMYRLKLRERLFVIAKLLMFYLTKNSLSLESVSGLVSFFKSFIKLQFLSTHKRLWNPSISLKT